MIEKERQERLTRIKQLQEQIKYHLLIQLALTQDEDVIFLLGKI